jgi:hypothetical protein
MNDRRKGAGAMQRIWWLMKAPYWAVRVRINPDLERRNSRRYTMRGAQQALDHSMTQMIDAFQDIRKQ